MDRAVSSTTDFTREFQDLLTRYAWGTIWTRPGLDRRTRPHLLRALDDDDVARGKTALHHPVFDSMEFEAVIEALRDLRLKVLDRLRRVVPKQ